MKVQIKSQTPQNGQTHSNNLKKLTRTKDVEENYRKHFFQFSEVKT